VGFFQAEISRVKVRVRVPATYGKKVGLKKLEFRPLKSYDPRFISFDALPACNGETDTPNIAKSRSGIAKLDRKLST